MSDRSGIAGYTQALLNYAEQIESSAPLEAERDALFVKLTGGNDGKSLVNSSINGKNFGWQVTLTLEEKFECFCRAIKLYEDHIGDSPLTNIDFGGMDDRSFSPIA